MLDRINAGEFLTIDECMSFWIGLQQAHALFAMPHITKIIRKPRGVGCELKSLADSLTKIILKLEIMEGKDVMETNEGIC